MKKILLVLVIFVTIFTIVACGSPQEHKHTVTGELIVVKEATCVEEGISHMFCKECGEIVNTVTIPKTDVHTEVVIPAIESTCTSTGLTEGKKCSVCEKVLVAQQEIPLKAHPEEILPAVEATCAQAGLSEGKKCSYCGETLVAQQTIPATVHTYDDQYDESCNKCGFIRDAECAHKDVLIVSGYEATCSRTGLTEGSQCKKCGEILVAQTAIPTKPHTETIDAAVEPTCTTIGLTEGKHCLYCETVIVQQEVIPTVEHVYNTTYSFDNSFHWYSCTSCDAIKDKTEHQLADDGMCTVCDQPIGATDGIIYDVSYDGTYAIVVDYQGTAASIKIAESYNGLPVTKIEDNAFKSKSITSVIIPDTVTIIGDYAFKSCSRLTTVLIGNNVKTIGYESFEYCSSLTTIIIPDSVTLIDVRAFASCENITHVTLGKGITKIGTGAFKCCYNLEKINIPDSLTNVQSDAFEYCSKVIEEVDGVFYVGPCVIGVDESAISVSIREGSRIIAAFAMYGSFDGLKLREIYIPSSVTHIGQYALATGGMSSGKLQKIHYGGTVAQWNAIEKPSEWNDYTGDYTIYCTDGEITKDGTIAYYVVASKGLEFTLNYDGVSYSVTGIGTCTDTDLIIPSTYNSLPVTSIGDFALNGCASLTSIVIPDSVTSIGTWAFADCKSLTSIEIGDSVTSIGGSALDGCTSLTSIEIPDSVTYIAECAFSNCTSLTNIEIPDSVTHIDKNTFYDCTSLTSIEIPDSVTGIGTYAFKGCISLTSVEIPDSVTYIGNGAFSGCTSLTSIEIPNSVTCICDYAFVGCESLTIYCEATSRPSGWHYDWNSSKRPVVWGYKPE